MIEVQMTNDIRRFETKTFGMFTTRQVVCILIGLFIGFPIGFAIPFSETSNKILVSMMLAIPFWLCGFIKIDHSPLEFIALRWLYMKVLTPPKRKCIRESDWRKEEIKIKEKRRLAKMTPKERKNYQKTKKVTVKYSKNPEFRGYK